MSKLETALGFSEKAFQRAIQATEFKLANSDDKYSAETIAGVCSDFEAYEKALKYAESEIVELEKNVAENSYNLRNLAEVKIKSLVELNQNSELIRFLQEFPHFEEGGLENLLSDLDDEVVPKVAKALVEAGHAEYLQSLLERKLIKTPSSDLYYEFFLENYEKADTLGLLEKVKVFHPFEERPYIWQAKILLEEEKVEEARETIQKAISMDPSDGEQGKDTRMLAYAVLSEVYQAKGDEEKTEFFANVVKAIRLSEGADELYAAGLISRAYEDYNESLEIFYDAYCIHSRLANNYSEEGKLEKAAEHYQKAFELMPDSFGRVESHCFGCEGAFSGEQAQGIAEKVFTKMLEERPEHPQLHYLMGYLKEAKEEYKPALASFKQAVKLDPLYLNAYKKISSVARELNDMESCEFALSKMDEIYPYKARVRTYDTISFKQLNKNLKARNDLVKTLSEQKATFRLKGAEERMELLRRSSYYSSHSSRSSDMDVIEFSEVVKQDELIRDLIRLSNTY